MVNGKQYAENNKHKTVKSKRSMVNSISFAVSRKQLTVNSKR